MNSIQVIDIGLSISFPSITSTLQKIQTTSVGNPRRYRAMLYA